MAKNLTSGPNFFSYVLPILDLTHCRKLSLFAISRKRMIEAKEGQKSHFGPD